MSDCCDPVSYRRFFNTQEANRRLKSYRRRGLDSMADSIVGFLKTQAIEGTTVLEVGGGVGDVQVELLKAGAGSATNVELSNAYEPAARLLATEAGMAERVSQQFGDFVEIQDEVEPADIVILNRVVCCYPWMERMMEAAVSKTRTYLGLVFPREIWLAKTGVAMGNKFYQLRGCGFRAYVHPVAGIEEVAVDRGLTPVHRHRNLGWHSVVFERSA